MDAANRLSRSHRATFLLGLEEKKESGVGSQGGYRGQEIGGRSFFPESRLRTPDSFRSAAAPVQVIHGETWDVLAHADLALAASGTVTIEAALLGTPMVTFYKVTPLSWWMGKFLVDVPFYSMVNLVAGRAVVPELMQNEVRGDRLAQEAARLLDDGAARDEMRRGLMEVAAKLRTPEDPMERAAHIVQDLVAGAKNGS